MNEVQSWLPSWEAEWLTEHLLLVVAFVLLLLLLASVVALMASTNRSMRQRSAMEREFRETLEASLSKQQTLHQAEWQQWQANQQALLQSEREQWQAQLEADRKLWQLEHERQLVQVREEQQAIAKREAHAELKLWIFQEEKRIRKDAVSKSRATIAGKISEQLIPYLPEFPFNPKDARFLGSPIDLVIFDGLDRGELRGVVLVEVKTRTSQLNVREKMVQEAVEAGRVEWRELRLEG